MRTLYTACACLTACSLFGQSGTLTRPSTGFVFDPAMHALRRIQGVPGAAVIGGAVDFGMPVSAVYVTPRLDSAMALGVDGQAHFFRLTGEVPVEVAVASLGTPLHVVFSPTGSAAALFSPSGVQVIKGLPDAPVVAANIALRVNSRPRRAVLETLAISDDGAYVIYAAGGPLELIDVAGNGRRIMDSGAGAVAAFAPGSHDAAVVNGAKLTLYRDISGAATERKFEGIATPSALAFSADGKQILVASASGRTVSIVQTADGERTSLGCNCAPESMIAMGGLFRLNEVGREPLWLFDPASDRGLFFVPAPTGN